MKLVCVQTNKTRLKGYRRVDFYGGYFQPKTINWLKGINWLKSYVRVDILIKHGYVFINWLKGYIRVDIFNHCLNWVLLVKKI